MKKIIVQLKKYLGIEDDSTVVVPGTVKKWKSLALELNEELQKTRELHAIALNEVIRLKRICKCQGELLAERGKQNG